MQSYFYDTAEYIAELITPEQAYLARLRAEDSDFVRFTGSAVRQAGTVRQLDLHVADGSFALDHDVERIEIQAVFQRDDREAKTITMDQQPHAASRNTSFCAPIFARMRMQSWPPFEGSCGLSSQGV